MRGTEAGGPEVEPHDWARTVFYAALIALLTLCLLGGYIAGKAHAEDACSSGAGDFKVTSAPAGATTDKTGADH